MGAGLGEGPEPHLHRFDGQNGGLQLQLSVHQPSVTSGEMWWQTFLLILTLLVFRCCSQRALWDQRGSPRPPT